MIRVVLDTNVLVSSILTRNGSEAQALDLAAARRIQIFLTPAILSEYEEVLSRSKFRRVDPNDIHGLLTLIRQVAIPVSPSETLTASPDESDNRFLECADAADADFLVTGNRRHFPSRWKRTAVIGARELLEIVSKAEQMS